MKGKIIKGIAGFYYVHACDLLPQAGGSFSGLDSDVHSNVYECKAKGIFRKDHSKPLVGDDVEMEILDEDKKLGNITAVLPRHSELIRPAVANVDQAVIIFAIVKPQPSFNLLDRFLIYMKQQDLPTIIVFNKLDLDEDGEGANYCDIYSSCGYRTLQVSAKTGEGIDEFKALLAGKTTTVAGPSGVGKSSLVNCLQSGVVMETGVISEKIDRGKHTTRHSELMNIDNDTYILDTPGFSSLDLFDMEKEDLQSFYPEFVRYEPNCRFGGCSHIYEPICGVKDAVKEGSISRMRYENYCLLYEELKNKRKY